MTIEVRRTFPQNNQTNVLESSNIYFDLVRIGGSDPIDITTLTITLEMISNVDGTTLTLNYTNASSEVSIIGSDPLFTITIDPIQPFDLNQNVTVKVNVDDTGGASMDEYEFTFTSIGSGIICDFRTVFLDCADKIPVYDEVLRKDNDIEPLVFDSAFNKWREKPTPRIKVNQLLTASDGSVSSLVTNTGYSIDYEEGKITFNSALTNCDDVTATYVFRFFSDEQIQGYLDQAVAVWNTYRGPNIGGNIYSVSFQTQNALMIGAAMYAFRDLLFCLAFQEKRIIFDNWSQDGGWTNVKDIFNNMYSSYKEQWEKLLEEKRYGLPNIASIVIPSISLPGGRSRFFRYLYKGGSSGG